MSYSFDMMFKQVTSKVEAFDVALEFSKVCYKYSTEYIEDSKYYLPSNRMYNSKQFEDKLKELDLTLTREKERNQLLRQYERSLDIADEKWLYNLFSFRFIYWEEEKLLAVVGCRYPKEAKELFDVCCYFQNSTDQDYELEHWGTKINVFNSIIDEIKNADVSKLSSIMMEKYDEDEFSEDKIQNHFGYYMRTCIYEEIYRRLNLNEWLWDHECDSFIRFSLNYIDSQEKEFEIQKKLLVLKKKLELD